MIAWIPCELWILILKSQSKDDLLYVDAGEAEDEDMGT